MRGNVVYIHLAQSSGTPLRAVEQVEAVAHCGLREDRHFDDNGTSGWRQITIVAEEDLLDFCNEYDIEYFPGCSRRQITTRNLDLKNLIGRKFRIGNAVCTGLEECHPCRQLAQYWTPQVLRGMLGKGGLRAAILSGGLINKGSEISIISESVA